MPHIRYGTLTPDRRMNFITSFIEFVAINRRCCKYISVVDTFDFCFFLRAINQSVLPSDVNRAESVQQRTNFQAKSDK